MTGEIQESGFDWDRHYSGCTVQPAKTESNCTYLLVNHLPHPVSPWVNSEFELFCIRTEKHWPYNGGPNENLSTVKFSFRNLPAQAAIR